TGNVEIRESPSELWRQSLPHCQALLEQLARLLPHCEARHDPAGHCPPDLYFVGPHRHSPGDRHTPLFLKSLEPLLRAAITARLAAELPAVGVVAVQALDLPPDLIRRLHDKGQCLGCYYRKATATASPATFGLFCYVPWNATGMAWPYGRLEVPVRPVRI